MTTATGEQLCLLEAIAATLAAATAPHRVYLDYAADALAYLIDTGRPFTVDEVRAHIPDEAGKPRSHNVLPALIGSAASRGVIRRVGLVTATRASRHRGRNAQWIGVPHASTGQPTRTPGSAGTCSGMAGMRRGNAPGRGVAPGRP